MRMDFDSSVSKVDQILRSASRKEPGRKHQKRIGAKKKEKLKATAKRRAKLQTSSMRKYKEQVSKYWNGERDTYPEKRGV